MDKERKRWIKERDKMEKDGEIICIIFILLILSLPLFCVVLGFAMRLMPRTVEEEEKLDDRYKVGNT